MKEQLMPSNARRVIDAFLAGDAPSTVGLLAPEAIFHSPIRDYAGADRIRAVWQAVAGVVTDPRATSVHERDAETIACFAGAIKDQPIDGVLRALTDDEDRVTEITLMVRPWAALKAGIAPVKV
jgi:SnoaL-like domain